jgi:hypothetical protein
VGRPQNAPRSSHRAPPGDAGDRGGRVVASSSLIGLHEVTATDTPEIDPRYEQPDLRPLLGFGPARGRIADSRAGEAMTGIRDDLHEVEEEKGQR